MQVSIALEGLPADIHWLSRSLIAHLVLETMSFTNFDTDTLSHMQILYTLKEQKKKKNKTNFHLL